MRVFITVLVLLPLVHSVTSSVCYNGYVMDLYCINRGTLLDNPSLETLLSPDKHSLHCLIDPAVCRNSGYELLADPAPGSNMYRRAYTLDGPGNEMAIALAEQTGSSNGCSRCTGGADAITQGFRATFYGTVDDSVSSHGTPPLLTVTRVDIAACANGTETIPTHLVSGAGGDFPFIVSHGSLMLLSWGLMLPSGVISARFLRHRENALWFRIHKMMQPVGLLFAIVGWSLALYRFDVFSGGAVLSLVHGCFGMITMVLGLLQPINAFFRPHVDSNQPKSSARQKWEYLHKGTGYLAVLLGLVTVSLGCAVAADALTPQLGYAWVAGAVVLASYGTWAMWNSRTVSLKKPREVEMS